LQSTVEFLPVLANPFDIVHGRRLSAVAAHRGRARSFD
jgi:hypothetical protein